MAPHTRRQRAFVAAALLVLGAGSCRDATAPVVPNPFPMTATWAGKPWVGSAKALVVPRPGKHPKLILWGASPVGADVWSNQDELTIEIVFDGPGEYVLDSTNAVYQMIVGGDLIWESYYATGSPAGLLTVTAFTDTQTIEGTLTLATRARRSGQVHGDYPKFEGGKFTAKYNIYP